MKAAVANRPLLLALALQGVVVLVTTPLYGAAGLSIPWSSIGGQLVYPAFFGVAALATARDRNGMPQALTALVVLLMSFLTIGPAQYLAAAWCRPLIDDQLLVADAELGIHQAALVGWTNAHEQIRFALAMAYITLVPQFVLPVAVLGFVDRHELWRYICSFHYVAIATIVLFAVWPAGVPALHGIPEVISQHTPMTQFFGLREGTMTTIRLEDAVGIISFPSFHAAGALVVSWALRRTWFRWPVVVLNAVLLASTVLLGLHYAVDVLAAAAIWAGAVVIERGLRPWLEHSARSDS